MIDSICKNVGEPYAGILANELMATYSRAFQDLHDRKLEYEFVRVLKTWRGVFPEPIVRELERRHDIAAVKPISTSSSVLAEHLRPKRPLRRDGLRISPALVQVLMDLRSAVAQPPHLYHAGQVASIFAHVPQINRSKAELPAPVLATASASTTPQARLALLGPFSRILTVFSVVGADRD